uniref:cellulase n=1 Tax=Salix viminalis TaxID=40686 RepID=A0A6N2LHE8_SALVM
MLVLEALIAEGFNYGDALDKTLMFFEAQRSGKLPANQRVKWRGDSGLKDGYLQGVNLVGGYYDAGDHVKFGLPMAYTVTMLAWGAIDFRKELTDLDQMGYALWSIGWGTDYFMKAHTQPNVLWAQSAKPRLGMVTPITIVGREAEDMTTPRTAYKLDQNHPGSDLAGETAAALAASAIAFKPYNSSYSNLLLLHAKQLFTFADRYRGLYDDSIQNAKQFYTSSGYSDELLWAAAWLYRATDDEYFLKYVVDNAVYMGGTGWGVKEFSWDNKYAGVQILLSQILLEGRGGAYTSTLKQYQAKANYFACACLQKNDGYNIHKTPGGLMYVREWNNLQYASAAAFLLAVYSDSLSAANAKLTCPEGQIPPQELLDFARSQADYFLGKNPKSMSYLVGYGPQYPIHRLLPSPLYFLFDQRFNACKDLRHGIVVLREILMSLYGALVGGPDQNDNFSDDRSNYEQTEPTLSGCAPLVGLFSKLQSVSGAAGNYHEKAPVPHPATPPSYHEARKTQEPSKSQEAPVEFLHSITKTWTVGPTTYYRHRVIIKNKSEKPVKDLKLVVEGLTGSIWGLIPTQQRNTYELPQWQKVLQPGSECSFVYVQGGPQAKVTVQSYN